ncbi:FeoC-like transcriptional regulator [Desulfogranum japonicum]|uniref:FeoC-like transcriptional regulator n=1 Tax=Desulfogranum japonicum TaxID=231447 RepID=UPI000491D62C|nr:FeoC-like transcriptional regulator [Desulfogranum japonicum]
MNLIEVRDYVQGRKLVPLYDIACHFRVNVEAVRPLLGVWVEKKKIVKHKGNIGCAKGCCACDPATVETYEWVGG